MRKWNFPGNRDGQVIGVVDFGIKNFVTIQNHPYSKMKLG